MPPLLKLYLDTLHKGEILAPFILLYGPGADKQWDAIREVSQTVSGFFALQDILELKDFSSEIGKEHILKVEYKRDNTISKLLQTEYGYQDLGSREVKDRLSLAPAGDMKILLVEHIERANGAAANALLKSFEEPLPQRVIIASAQNKDAVIGTILSRALLVYCDSLYSKPVLESDQNEVLNASIQAIHDKNIVLLSKLASTIGKGDWMPHFLEALLYYYYTVNSFVQIPLIIEAIQYRASNVSAEHTLFQMFLQLGDHA